jgi:hypothetical protein
VICVECGGENVAAGAVEAQHGGEGGLYFGLRVGDARNGGCKIDRAGII